MRHRVAGRKLGRKTEHRIAMLRNLSTSLFRHERIKTTLEKAKDLRPFAERLVTIAKGESLHARRRVLRHIQDGKVVEKLFDTLSARYAQRPGGYTRIIRIGPRRGDHAEMAVIELVDSDKFEAPPPAEKKKTKSKAKKKKAAGASAAKKAKPAKSTKKKTAKKAKAKASKAAPRKTAKKKTAKKKAGVGDK